MERFTKDIGNEKRARELIEKDHSLVRFYLPHKTYWSEIVKHHKRYKNHLDRSEKAFRLHAKV
ncbi:MAG: hypothetical protein ACUVQP_08715 [Bacteroidales bacterium]